MNSWLLISIVLYLNCALTFAQATNSNNANEQWQSTPSQIGNDPIKGQDISEGIRIEEILEPPSEYHYAAFDKPDPFAPPLLRDGQPVTTGEEIPIVSPLQRSLEQLLVRGIWLLESGERRALIETLPEHQGIITKVGDPIGLGGKILEIAEDHIIARDYYILEDGTREFNDKILPLGTWGSLREKMAIIQRPGEKPYIKKYDNIVKPKIQEPPENKNLSSNNTMPDINEPANLNQNNPIPGLSAPAGLPQ